MRDALLVAHQHGVAIYAECGGLMYLGSRLTTASGEAFPMVGIFQGESRMATAFSFSKTRDGQELKRWSGGYKTGNTLASYLHVHFGQNPAMLLNWFSRGRAKA